MASKKEKGNIDSKALKPESTHFFSLIADPYVYIRLPSSQYPFSIEKNHSHIKSSGQLALSYFPPDFHWIPEHPQKNLAYYTNILIQTESVHFKPIFGKTSDSPKLLGNVAYFVKFISKKDWGVHPSTLRPFVNSNILYSYYDYINVWYKFMLFQTLEYNHFLFINFDKKFKGTLPIWFLQWWKQFGLIPDILPPLLVDAFHLFKTHLNHKDFDSNFSPILHFAKNYKVPWFLRWYYVIKDTRMERHWLQAKLWDKSPRIDAIVNSVKGMAQASKASASLQISPRGTSSSSSNISKKKELINTFFDSLENCSDEDEEKNC
jgi:hypothetical protein